ncbi:potassium channel family protein [Pseudomonadota bacterium]|jgi:Trk-type K+ transport system membrane component
MGDSGHTLTVLLIGIGMIGLTVIINVAGVVLWLRVLGRRIERRAQKNQSPHLFRAILDTAVALLMLHVVEAYLWALLYFYLPGQSGLDNMHDAFYFSAITFTTLGYGDVTLSSEWQLLSGLEGMIGIMMFGMSTALLYAVIQKCWMVKHKGRIDMPEN